MKQLDLMVRNHSGLHARPAKELVNLAKTFSSKISIRHGAKTVNAKSMISVLTLGVKPNGAISIIIDGEDEGEAAVAIEEAVISGLGEEVDAAPESEVESPRAKVEEKAGMEKAGIENDRIVAGVAVSSGVAVGDVWRYIKEAIRVNTRFEGVSAETLSLDSAIQKANADLKSASEKIDIFAAHLEILNDPEIYSASVELINQKRPAAVAWKETMDFRAKSLSQLDNAILAERSADISDVRDRVLAILSGQSRDPWASLPEHPIILVADELFPSDTIGMDKSRVLAICTADGSATSHSAILARELNVPAIMGIGDCSALTNGQTVIVNGDSGKIILDPTDEEKADAKKSAEAQAKIALAQAAASQDPAITTDGHRVEIAGNVGSAEDAQKAYANGAEGSGLCRTEFIFLHRSTAPTLDEQTSIYTEIINNFEGYPVVFRTLDVGGDKPLAYLPQPEEDNPFLGIRGIRLCLAQPELLETQIRAILSAGPPTQLRIMFPMISDVAEWRDAKAMVSKIAKELSVDVPQCGIMIEVPSAALMADAFAAEVDFFSVGTNDLTQYTMAMDRLHPQLANSADGLHPAILRLIDMTVKAAHAHGKWVGICGELGSDPQAIPILVGLGVDELSVTTTAVAKTKAKIRELTLTDAQTLAKSALACATAKDVRNL